jgi:hypothetical protein
MEPPFPWKGALNPSFQEGGSYERLSLMKERQLQRFLKGAAVIGVPNNRKALNRVGSAPPVGIPTRRRFNFMAVLITGRIPLYESRHRAFISGSAQRQAISRVMSPSRSSIPGILVAPGILPSGCANPSHPPLHRGAASSVRIPPVLPSSFKRKK